MDTEVKKATNSDKVRNYGIDLFRIVSMFMVVLLHVLGRGGILDGLTPLSPQYYIARVLEVCAFCAVNCYALISGYVGYNSKHSLSGIVRITFSVIFYVILGTLVACLVFPGIKKGDILSSLLHLRSGGYWYYRAYLGAFFFFPLLNLAVEKLERRQMKRIIIALLVIYSVFTTVSFSDLFSVEGGYSPVWLMVIYLLGAYIRKYNVASGKSPLKYAGLYFLVSLFSLLSMIILEALTLKFFGNAMGQRLLISYTSPTMVISAVMLLIAFANVKIGNKAKKIIGVCAPLTFGVYLAHMQYFVREWLSDRFVFALDYNPVVFIVAVIGITLAIYVAGSMIDYLRSFIFKHLGIDKMIKIISEKFNEIQIKK